MLLLAEHGYDAVGVDISDAAILDAKVWVNDQLNKTQSSGGLAPKGAIQLVAGDFFKDDWVESLGIEVEGGFDIIYDYAVSCSTMPLHIKNWHVSNILFVYQFLVALNPVLRSKVAARMTQLLAPKSGLLVALEYPLFRPVETGGPPHGIKSKNYEELFGGSFEKKLHYKPERTHKVGEGSDMVSVWKRH